MDFNIINNSMGIIHLFILPSFYVRRSCLRIIQNTTRLVEYNIKADILLNKL